MNVFKKTCFECGKKVDEIKKNLCIDCYKQINPPIKEIKPLNVKLCTICERIHFNNHFFDVEEFEEHLPDVMKKKITLNEGYKLNKIKIKDLEIRGRQLEFNVQVDCDFINK